MRIAHISVHGCPLARLGERDTGGMNVYILHLAQELGKLGVEVDVFTRTHDSRDPPVVELSPNARVIHIKAGEWNEAKEDIFPHLPEFLCNLRYITTSQKLLYDVVHSHYWLSGWVAGLLKKRWNAPHIFTPHTLGIAKREALPGQEEPDLRIQTEKRIAAESDGIITLISQDKELLSRAYGTPPNKITVIPGGVDTQLFKPMNKEEARTRLGLDKERILLFVGRIDPIKGVEILLDVVALLKSWDDIRLLVVGGRPEVDLGLQRLQQRSQELGIQERVKFVGAVPQQQLPIYYSAADVCVTPSYYESFGMVALEAMACGVPVLSSKVGIAQSIIRNGENGYLVPWQCPEAFAEKLELLLRRDGALVQMGTNARASVREFHWESVAGQVYALYQHLSEGLNQKFLGG